MDLTKCVSLKMIHYSKRTCLADDENCLGIVPNKSLKFMCGKCKYNLTRPNENNKDSSITCNYFEKELAPATFSFQKSIEKFSSSDSQT